MAADRILQEESFNAQSAGCRERNGSFSFVSGWMGKRSKQRKARKAAVREIRPVGLVFEKTGLTRRPVCCPYRESIN